MAEEYTVNGLGAPVARSANPFVATALSRAIFTVRERYQLSDSVASGAFANTLSELQIAPDILPAVESVTAWVNGCRC